MTSEGPGNRYELIGNKDMRAGSEDFANIWFPNIWGEHQMGTALNQPSNAITIIITIAIIIMIFSKLSSPSKKLFDTDNLKEHVLIYSPHYSKEGAT